MKKPPKPGGHQPLQVRRASPGREFVKDPEALRRFLTASRVDAHPIQLPLDGMESHRPRHVPARLSDGREPQAFGLFLAGFPEIADAFTICEESVPWVHAHGLRDALQAPERAHVTLCSLNRGDPLDRDRHDAAKAAVNQITCAALPMVFDRAVSFKTDGAFMLLADAATNAAVARLRRPLVKWLRGFGLEPDEIAMPHMTLVYNCGQVVPEHPVAPLAWTMRRVALVLSHIGCAHHEILAEWALPSH